MECFLDLLAEAGLLKDAPTVSGPSLFEAARAATESAHVPANPLPVMVISHMLGVPHEHYPIFKQWSDTVVESHNTPPGMPLPQTLREAFTALREYFIAEI